jgi:hypothetical protein
MSEQVTTPWQGDWQARLQAKLQSLGYASLEDYLSANPGVDYLKVAESLEQANVAAMQLYGEHIRIAAREGRLRHAAADCLSRFLAQHVKRGWGCGRHFPLRVASAFGDWKTLLRQFSESDDALDRRLDAVTEAIEASNPPKGWLPINWDDEIIREAFDVGWPIQS